MYLDFSRDNLARPNIYIYIYISQGSSGYKTQLLISKRRSLFALDVFISLTVIIALNTSKKLTSTQWSLERSTGDRRESRESGLKLDEAPRALAPFVNI